MQKKEFLAGEKKQGSPPKSKERKDKVILRGERNSALLPGAARVANRSYLDRHYFDKRTFMYVFKEIRWKLEEPKRAPKQTRTKMPSFQN